MRRRWRGVVPAVVVMAMSLAGGCGARSGFEVGATMESMDAGLPSDARMLHDTDSSRTVCALGAPNASVRGTTPLGPVDARFAWASETEGCGDHLWLGETSSLVGSSLPRPPEPWISIAPTSRPDEVRVRVGIAGEELETLGTMRVEEHVVPVDDPYRPGDSFCVCTDTGLLHELPCELGTLHGHVAGELALEAPGWSLHGRFRAPHCHALHAICF